MARLRYLELSETPRLHIGASNRALEGWLNTDLVPSEGVSYLDATAPLPFKDATFAFVYSEHMIEHVGYPDAAGMMAECLRILRPGGILRLVTPDLDSVLSVHRCEPNSRAAEYRDWMSKTFTPDAPNASSTFVINAMFRMWGHQFLYDCGALTELLNATGFAKVRRCRIDESEHPLLRNLSNANRYPNGLLDYESLCVEAVRP